MTRQQSIVRYDVSGLSLSLKLVYDSRGGNIDWSRDTINPEPVELRSFGLRLSSSRVDSARKISYGSAMGLPRRSLSPSYLRGNDPGKCFRRWSTMRRIAAVVLVLCYVCSSNAFIESIFGGSSHAQDLTRSISSLGAPLGSLEGILEMMRPVLERDGLPGPQWPIVLPVPVRKYVLKR